MVSDSQYEPLGIPWLQSKFIFSKWTHSVKNAGDRESNTEPGELTTGYLVVPLDDNKNRSFPYIECLSKSRLWSACLTSLLN